MARRQDAHFLTSGEGNFGGAGVLDWAMSTGIGNDVLDDMRDEMEKRNVPHRANNAIDDVGDKVADAGAKLRGKGKKGRPRKGS